VHIPRDVIGRLAFSCLAGSGNSSREIVIEPELIVRESTAPAKRR
jgi:DNA-binding LacI/PurR family transcriptional regulator